MIYDSDSITTITLTANNTYGNQAKVQTPVTNRVRAVYTIKYLASGIKLAKTHFTNHRWADRAHESTKVKT